MITRIRSNKVLLNGLVMFLCVVSFSGCASLRKKFTRKNKVKAEDKFIPVLEPVEYKKAEESPAQKYAYHYSMVKMYFKDLWEVLGRQHGGDKREKYILTELLGHFDAMSLFLDSVKKDEAKTLRLRVEEILKEYDQAGAIRRYDLISGEMRKIERDLLKAFKPALVAGAFVSAE